MTHRMVTFDVTLSVSRSQYYTKANIIQIFFPLQLPIIYLLNLEYNVPLMCGPSALAEPLLKCGVCCILWYIRICISVTNSFIS